MFFKVFIPPTFVFPNPPTLTLSARFKLVNTFTHYASTIQFCWHHILFYWSIHPDALSDDENIIWIRDERLVGVVAWHEDDFAAVSVDLPEDGVLLGTVNDSVDFAVFVFEIFADEDCVSVIYFSIYHGVSMYMEAVVSSDRIIYEEVAFEVLLAEDAVSGAYGPKYWKRICGRG